MYSAYIVFISKQHCRNEEYLSRREVIPLSSPLHPLTHPPTTPIHYPYTYRSGLQKCSEGGVGLGRYRCPIHLPLICTLFCSVNYNSVCLPQFQSCELGKTSKLGREQITSLQMSLKIVYQVRTDVRAVRCTELKALDDHSWVKSSCFQGQNS